MPWVTRYHRYDGQGNTRQLTDETGTVTDTFDYDAWGNELARTGTTKTPFRWNGRVGYYWDEDTGTYQVRRRPYRSKIGRWGTVDPIWPMDGINPYTYAYNNWINSLDPSGLEKDEKEKAELNVAYKIADKMSLIYTFQVGSILGEFQVDASRSEKPDIPKEVGAKGPHDVLYIGTRVRVSDLNFKQSNENCTRTWATLKKRIEIVQTVKGQEFPAKLTYGWEKDRGIAYSTTQGDFLDVPGILQAKFQPTETMLVSTCYAFLIISVCNKDPAKTNGLRDYYKFCQRINGSETNWSVEFSHGATVDNQDNSTAKNLENVWPQVLGLTKVEECPS